MKNWKKWLCLATVACLFMVTASACGGSGGSGGASSGGGGGESATTADEGGDAETPTFTNLKIAHPHPKGSATDIGWEKFKELIYDYSGGTIEASVYPAGSLVSTADAVDAIRNGTVDFAQISSGDVATIIPALNIIEIPGTFSQIGTEYVDGVRPVMREIMEPYGFIFLAPQPGTPSWLFSNLKQIKSPADMKGLNVRASGKYGGEAIKAWGGNPVTISLPDLTTAMERNTVDVILTPGLGAYSNGWYELEHYITISEVTTLMAMMVMNVDLYNSFTPEQQEAVDRAGYEAAMHMYEATMAEVEEGFGVMEAYGNEFYTLSPEENAAFLDLSRPLAEALIEEIGDDARKLDEVLALYR